MVTAPTPGQRDLQAEQDHAEWRGWMEANNYSTHPDDCEGMAEAFAAGMQAQRDLTAVTGDGTLRTRITHLAETWEGNPELTEEGGLLRELGQILYDELGHASDREPQAAPESGTALYLSAIAILSAGLREVGQAIERGDASWVVARFAAAALSDVDRLRLPKAAPEPPAMTPAVSRPSPGGTIVLAFGASASEESVASAVEALTAATEGEGLAVVTVRGVEALRNWEPQPGSEADEMRAVIDMIWRMCQQGEEAAGAHLGDRIAGLIKNSGMEPF